MCAQPSRRLWKNRAGTDQLVALHKIGFGRKKNALPFLIRGFHASVFPPRVQKACSTPKSEYVFGNEVSGLDFENVSIEVPAGLLGRCQDGIKKESTFCPNKRKSDPKTKNGLVEVFTGMTNKHHMTF